MKRWIWALVAGSLLTATVCVAQEQTPLAGPQVDCAGAVLMELETGTLLFEQGAHQQLEPASVTKVMSMLLVMEAITQGRTTLEDVVTVSARAASMGGSQVYL